MRVVLQRVSDASISIHGELVTSIGFGLVVLLGVSVQDTDDDSRYIVNKILNIRIFPDDRGHFNLSAMDVGADLLVVSQFTLYANTRKGRRPDFTGAAPSQMAELAYERVLELLKESYLNVRSGCFQVFMTVRRANQGPATIVLDSSDRLTPRRKE